MTGILTIKRDKTDGKRRLLAKAGDRLTLIAGHGDVLIVEKGYCRFSVRKDEVMEVPP